MKNNIGNIQNFLRRSTKENTKEARKRIENSSAHIEKVKANSVKKKNRKPK